MNVAESLRRLAMHIEHLEVPVNAVLAVSFNLDEPEWQVQVDASALPRLLALPGPPVKTWFSPLTGMNHHHLVRGGLQFAACTAPKGGVS